MTYYDINDVTSLNVSLFANCSSESNICLWAKIGRCWSAVANSIPLGHGVIPAWCNTSERLLCGRLSIDYVLPET